MAVNPLISLQAQAPDVGSAINNGLLNAQNIQKIQGNKMAMDEATQMAELKSMVQGGEQARLAFQQGGREGLAQFLMNRMEAGPTVKGGRGMQDTQEFLNMVSDQSIPDEQILGQLDAVRDVGVRYNILNDPSSNVAAPSSVREWEYYNSLDEQAKKDYLEMKRSSQIVDIGGGGKGRVTQGGQVETLVSSEDATGKDVKRQEGLEKVKSDSQVQAEGKIVEIKNAGLAKAEQEKLLGIERGKITTEYRANGRTARSSKSNLLRLKRALDFTNTGKVAQGRNLLGDVIPGIKDADAETFNSLAAQYALAELSKQSGTKTDFDFKKAEETQARLGNSKEANEKILAIAFDRLDEIEYEERKFKEFVDRGNNPEDFVYTPVPIQHIEVLRANSTNEKLRKDFQDKYGYLPTGL